LSAHFPVNAPLTAATASEIADILQRAVNQIRASIRTSANGLADLPHRSAHVEQPDMDTLLDPPALAALLKIDERTLRRLRAAREIPEPIMFGRKPRWRRHVIDAFLAERSKR
jgi:predicted DNA-binding transcriptional regulator AlpA